MKTPGQESIGSMGGVAATFAVDATCLWVTGESLVHQHQVHGQRSQTVVPLEEMAAVELEEAPDRRLLFGAGGFLAVGLAGGLAATPLVIPVALVGILGCLLPYSLIRRIRVVIRAPTQTIEIQVAGEIADDLADFARRLEAIRLGRQARPSAGATDLDDPARATGPRQLGQG